jgi:hypothetical protein
VAFAQTPLQTPLQAVCRISSHGLSGTVIYSVPGKTLILTAAHMFTGDGGRVDPRLRNKPITVQLPASQPSSEEVVIRVSRVDYQRDLALIEAVCAPCPVLPVGEANHRYGRCYTAGYDEMRWPLLTRWAVVLSTGSRWTITREKPWHGRSGGPLIDMDAGRLVGVVSAYSEMNPHAVGIEVTPTGDGRHVSLASVRAFLGLDSSSAQPQPRPAQPALRPACPT